MVGGGSQGVAKGHMRDATSQAGVKVVGHTYHAPPAPRAQSGRLFAHPPSSPGAVGVGAVPRPLGAAPFDPPRAEPHTAAARHQSIVWEVPYNRLGTSRSVDSARAENLEIDINSQRKPGTGRWRRG